MNHVDLKKQAILNERLAEEAGHPGPACEYCIRKDITCPPSVYQVQPATFCNLYQPVGVKAEKTEPSKPSNPKYALGIKKTPVHCIPCRPLLEVGLAFAEGGRKYGTHNYRDIGVRASTYYNAAMRHIMDWWEGEDIDPDSGIHHIVKAIASLFVVRDSMHMGNLTDDRPIRYPNGLQISELNKMIADIIKKYPGCKAPFLQKDKEKDIDRTKPVPGGY